jgi:hypothetical protein
MAGWYERAVQTSFKLTPDGYEFRCPNPWLFGHWRSYLVNEAQKESLAVHLRQRQRLILWLVAIYLLIAVGISILFSWSGAPDISPSLFLVMLLPSLLGMLTLVLVPHFYLMRKIEPLLAQLPRTDARASLHEQIFGVAAVIGNLHLVMGGVGGALIAISNIKTIAESLSEGQADPQLVWPAIGLLIGALMASYFAYLAFLKRKLKRKMNDPSRRGR